MVDVQKQQVIILVRVNVASIIFTIAGGKNCGKTAVAPGLGGSANARGSRSAYMPVSMARPDHLWIGLCGHVSCLRAVTICWQRARSQLKYGRGANDGFFFRNSITSLKAMIASILWVHFGDN